MLSYYVSLRPYCNVCYDFRIKTDVWFTLSPFVCRSVHVLLCLLCMLEQSDVQYVVLSKSLRYGLRVVMSATISP